MENVSRVSPGGCHLGGCSEVVLGAESKHLGLGEMYPCMSLGVGEDAASSVPRAAGRSQLLQEQAAFGAFHLGVACFMAQGKAPKPPMVPALRLRNGGASSAGAPGGLIT